MTNTAKTKIIATIGPSSWDKETLNEMYKNGMQIARINASFADLDEIIRVSNEIRELSPRIALMLDMQGTKIRVVDLKEDMEVKDKISISSSNQNVPNSIKISYPDLHMDVFQNTRILIDDGTIELSVKEVKGPEILCEVIQPGTLKPNKTVNIPDINLNFPVLTEKDESDIQNAVKNNFDFICISFVRNAQDILYVKEITKNSDIKIIAKIENQEGLDHFDEILKETDAIMIARGDLGVETPLENIPLLQKQMIYKSRVVGKPVIVATQMLESMRNNKQPTRAEVSDVANSVMDGADALMLSAETSTGENPIEAIKMMKKIILGSEKFMQLSTLYGNTRAPREVDELCKSVCLLTESVPLKGIVVLSDNAETIGSISRHRPNVSIWSISSSLKRIRQDSMFRGVKTYHIKDLPDDRDETIMKAVQTIYTHGELDLTDKIAIITGSSIKQKNSDVILEIATIKDVLSK
jgi:pyruvate kinase